MDHTVIVSSASDISERCVACGSIMTFSGFLAIIFSFSLLFIAAAMLYKAKKAPGSLMILISLTLLAVINLFTLFFLVPNYGSVYSSQFVFIMRMTENISFVLVCLGVFRAFRFFARNEHH